MTPITNPNPPDPAAGWTPDELQNPHEHAHKADKVRGMFAAIARSYDLNNRLHSLGQDQAWRRAAVRAAAVKPADHVLDAACGTGDLTLAFARAGAARVIGLDFTPQMLDVARHKRDARLARSPAHRWPERADFTRGDAMELPFPDASFDIVSIAFGIRNIAQPHRAIAEFRRVLRPGGRLVILEFADPSFAPVRWFNAFYCRRLMPVTATWISRDRTGAYRYLPSSVHTFMTPPQLESLLTQSGFASVRSRPLSLGICRCYLALTDHPSKGPPSPPT